MTGKISQWVLADHNHIRQLGNSVQHDDNFLSVWIIIRYHDSSDATGAWSLESTVESARCPFGPSDTRDRVMMASMSVHHALPPRIEIEREDSGRSRKELVEAGAGVFATLARMMLDL